MTSLTNATTTNCCEATSQKTAESFAALPKSLTGLLVRAIEGLAVWQERYSTRRHLAQLDQRMLDDIGLSHEDRLKEARKPVWRA